MATGLLGGSGGTVSRDFNAQDPSTWPVQFGRDLSPQEIAYYAPAMQKRYDTEVKREELYGRSNLEGSPGMAALYSGQPSVTTGGTTPQPAAPITGGVTPKPGPAITGGVTPQPAAPATGGVTPQPAPPIAASAAAKPAANSVADLYTGLLGRTAGADELDYWQNKFGGNAITEQNYAEFLAAARPELQQRVDQVYRDTFGREADTAGREYWQQQVGAGKVGSAQELQDLIAGGRKGYDVDAYNDKAVYDTAWNGGLSADDKKLVYNAQQDRWEVQTGSGGGGGNTYNADLNRQVDAKTMTIEGRINNILARDVNGNYTNPVIQQAAMQARQSFAGRGLLNSSMAEQAALEAVTAKAIEIAGPDAQTYFSQSRANQDATNVFARDEQNYKYDLGKMGVQHGYDLEKLGAAHGYDLEKLAKGNEYDLGKIDKTGQWDMKKLEAQLALERDKLTRQDSQFNKELQYKYDALNINDSSRLEAEERAHRYAVEINEINAVNSAYDLYLRRISDIDNNKDLDAATKVQMKNAAGKDFDLYAKAKKITWEMNLGNRFALDDQGKDREQGDAAKKPAGGNPLIDPHPGDGGP